MAPLVGAMREHHAGPCCAEASTRVKGIGTGTSNGNLGSRLLYTYAVCYG